MSYLVGEHDLLSFLVIASYDVPREDRSADAVRDS
jgi:hypothetical protein